MSTVRRMAMRPLIFLTCAWMLCPWELRLTAGFLGRSAGGQFFHGALTDVTFYSRPLIEAADAKGAANGGPIEVDVQPFRHAVAESWQALNGDTVEARQIGTQKLNVLLPAE